jgi:site-specific DNA-methyltransferase (adenine-specific)
MIKASQDQANFTLRGRNPDVLTCIANLSNDEVFTPPEFANRMLDTLAAAWAADHGGEDLWANKSVRFLDPFTKSGVFLREITSRLTTGLKNEIPDLQKRVNHILAKQVFGIGITHMTSLLARRSVYCSKFANGKHSVAKSFENEQGNIWFERTEHTWEGSKCKYCGAPKVLFDRKDVLETYAYAFLHTNNIKTRIDKIFGGSMQFDVIIGNPPYQMAGGAGGSSDSSIYHLFVEQAMKLEPRYLSMVTPARWLAGGRGMNEFRAEMLSSGKLRELVDYRDSKEVFPGVSVEGGIVYFLWDKSHNDNANVTTVRGKDVIGPFSRDLNEFDVFVRDSRAVKILHKVQEKQEPSIIEILTGDTPFGIATNFDGWRQKEKSGDVALYLVKSGKRSQ